MVKLKKKHISITQNLRILGAYCFIEIFLVFYDVYVMLRDQDQTMFYVKNYIDWDQFNQLYNSD